MTNRDVSRVPCCNRIRASDHKAIPRGAKIAQKAIPYARARILLHVREL